MKIIISVVHAYQELSPRSPMENTSLAMNALQENILNRDQLCAPSAHQGLSSPKQELVLEGAILAQQVDSRLNLEVHCAILVQRAHFLKILVNLSAKSALKLLCLSLKSPTADFNAFVPQASLENPGVDLCVEIALEMASIAHLIAHCPV
eukprot:TRINITY_DN9403_c0_g1_i1.p1 TRINITY_DN9403_c0_g1~~TRINITY_DN9403_c0_g1_i1.p1  ORF type:complete len:150 (+),score=27.26 TRINITY_DN9403_c0_g1_i1:106-555(+)